MQWYEAILYGLIAGIAEFLPISSEAHGTILLKLFGVGQEAALLRLMVHIGSFVGILFFMRSHLATMHKQAALKRIPIKRRKRFPDPRYISELSLLKMAAVPVVLASLMYAITVRWSGSLQMVAAFSAINGVFLLLPAFLASGNKEARSTSLLDRILIGLSAFLSVLPGVSRIGATTTTALIRGGERELAYRWGVQLLLPALAVIIVWDMYLMATAGIGMTFGLFACGVLSGVCAFAASGLAIRWMQSILEKSSISGFGYYSLGAALFTFILYLI